MRKVELVPGVHSSILGFGCAPILGAVGGKVADRALKEALERGVTHFDVARSYGYGEAETFVGRFLKNHRDDVVIATKFGIRATWKASLFRPLKPLVRALKQKRSSPNPGPTPPPVFSPRRDPFHERVPITPDSMRASLHRSLRALKTDYLDLLFVHEPLQQIKDIHEVIATAESLKKEGKILGFGLAFDWASHELFESDFSNFDLLQFNNSPGHPHYSFAKKILHESSNVFFSPLRGAPGKSPNQILSQMWSDFPKSVILCSMFNPEHIKANAEAANL